MEPSVESRTSEARRAPAAYSPGEIRVLILAVVLLAVTTVLHLGHVADLPALDAPFSLSWLVLLALFYLAEARVVHIEFRQEAQAFSLNEIPIVLGLFFVEPSEMVAAAVLGTLVGLVVHRRQRPLKLLFNSGQMWLSVAVTLTIFHLIVPAGTDLLGPVVWMGTLVAVLLGSLVNVVAIAAAISLAEGRADLERLPEGALLASVGTATTASIALIGATLMWVEPSAAWLLVVPAVSIYVAFLAYTSEKQKHESLEFLYESSRILHQYPEVEAAVSALLSQARETFRTEMAEVTLFPASAEEAVLRTAVTDGAHQPAMNPVEITLRERSFVDAVSRGDPTIVTADGDAPLALRDYIEARGLRDAMVAPLRGETRVIGAMLLGNRLGQVTGFRSEELRLFETLANQASVSLENGRLERTLTQLTTLKEELRHQAFHDTLTGLANRALFTERVQAATADPATTSGSVAVLYLDLDDFKSVNDTFGHDAGDRLLVQIAQRVQGSLRPNDLAARLGGDEFAVLLRDVHDTGTATAVAERIISALRFPVAIGDQDLTVRSSIGIALNGDLESAAELIRNADVAMYRAKHEIKGRYAIYAPEMRDLVVERLTLKTELMAGVDRDEFVVHYQTLVDLRTRHIVGLEALIRWEHPERGLVPPDQFLSLAEETGLILPMGEEVLRQSTQQVAAWSRALGTDLLLSVNISARQLKNPGLTRSVSEALDASGLSPANLLLEITEQNVMDDTVANLTKLNNLKALGVRLGIDDFGTGYSSLAYLRRFPMDVVKLAKPFVDPIEHGPEEEVLAHAVVELSHALGMSTIAEGLESPGQAQLLDAWGCEIAQGYLFARPESAQATGQRLADAHRAGMLDTPDRLRRVQPA